MSMLGRHRSQMLIAEPFPHLVIENVLDPRLAEQLTAEFPPLDFFTAGKRIGDCTKRYYAGATALRDASISETWKRCCGNPPTATECASGPSPPPPGAAP